MLRPFYHRSADQTKFIQTQLTFDIRAWYNLRDKVDQQWQFGVVMSRLHCPLRSLESRVATYRPSSCLFLPGQPVEYLYHVHSGICGLYKIDYHGKERLVMVTLPGHFVGIAALGCLGSMQLRHVTEARALTNVTVGLISLNQIRSTIATDILLFDYMLQAVVDTWFTNGLVFQFEYHRDGRARILILLLLLASRIGIASEKGVELVGITHELLASLTKLSRQTVTRLLNSLAEAGILETKRRTIVLKQVDRLTDYDMQLSSLLDELRVCNLLFPWGRLSYSLSERYSHSTLV